MRYLTVSTAVTDEIYLDDGSFQGTYLGGAGIYALSGIRLWEDSVLLVTGVGDDFMQHYGAWFRASECAASGLLKRSEPTPISRIHYLTNGERNETPSYGKDEYRKMEARPEELAYFYKNVKGVYIFKDIPDGYWEKIIADKKKHQFHIMWEMNAEAVEDSSIEKIRETAEACGMFSLNLSEAGKLFHTEDRKKIIQNLQNWKLLLVYLRMGSQGAMLITESSTIHIPIAKCDQVVDPTGAGNSSTAAVLYGYCSGCSLLECGVMGAVSAIHSITQYGPPCINHAVREQAVLEKKEMLRRLEGKSGKEQ